MLDLSDLAEKTSARELCNHFKRRYSARYGHPPVLTSEDDAIFEWLVGSLGMEKGPVVIDEYLKSNDRFFLEKGHAPKFIKNNVNTFLASADRSKAIPKKREPIMIRASLTCRCGKGFDWVGPAGDIEKAHRCPHCSGNENV